MVVRSGAFWSLVRLHSGSEISQLSSSSRKRFFEGLTLAGAGHKERQDGEENAEEYYIRQVPKSLQERFSEIVRVGNFDRLVHEEAVRSGIVLTLESLAGVVRGCQLTSAPSVFPVIRELLPDLVTVLDKGHNYTLLVESVLDFLISCAKSVLHFLSERDTSLFYNSTLESMQVYAKHRKGRLTVEKNAEDEFFNDLTMLMDLLLNLLTKDMLDMGFSEPADVEKMSASAVCLNGLFIVMPLLSLELLRFPSLCQQFFKTITYVAEIHTEKIFELPPEMMTQILSSIEIGLTTYGPNVTSLCCDFLQAVALFIKRKNLQGSPLYQAASHFLKIMLDLIISGKISSELMTTASSSLYALITAYQV
ncbi:exportin-4-like [Artemia franciscana]|uniref:exportin-4-like n=1 Tax=Artemia franciscana TaxID=6661 RepID=UPI0032DBE7F1